MSQESLESRTLVHAPVHAPVRDEDRAGLLTALWTHGLALTSEAAATIDDLASRVETLEARAEAAERDRDYWREQHDLTLADWKSDLQELAAARTLAETQIAEAAGGREIDRQAAEETAKLKRALHVLLSFYDPRTGAVLARDVRGVLSDAFAEAARLCGPASGV